MSRLRLRLIGSGPSLATDRLRLRLLGTRAASRTVWHADPARRDARDAEATRAIYNVEVLESTVTFDLVPRSLEDQQRWIDEHSAAIPRSSPSTTTPVLGFASLSPFKARAAYAPTVEDSVYVHRDARGRASASCCSREIVPLGTDHGFHSVMARIVGGHDASIALHRKCGFEEIGCEREVGRKFGKLARRRADAAHACRQRWLLRDEAPGVAVDLDPARRGGSGSARRARARRCAPSRRSSAGACRARARRRSRRSRRAAARANCTGWCMKSPVSNACSPSRLDPQRGVPGRVARRRFEPEPVAEVGVGLHDVGEARRRRSARRSRRTRLRRASCSVRENSSSAAV